MKLVPPRRVVPFVVPSAAAALGTVDAKPKLSASKTVNGLMCFMVAFISFGSGLDNKFANRVRNFQSTPPDRLSPAHFGRAPGWVQPLWRRSPRRRRGPARKSADANGNP